MILRFVGLVSALVLASNTSGAVPGEEGVTLYRSLGIEIPAPAPDRDPSEGDGPYARLVIENVMIVDGLGSPPRGPVSIVVEEDKIASIHGRAPAAVAGEERLDGKGMTALPGFIDAHAHVGSPGQGMAGPIVPPEYVFKLWLAHGITTVRDVGSTMGLEWTVNHANRSLANDIVAPKIVPYSMFPGSVVTSDKDARSWVWAPRVTTIKMVFTI